MPSAPVPATARQPRLRPLRAATAYIGLVVLAGAAIIAAALTQPDVGDPLSSPTIWVLVAGVVLGELLPIRIRRDGPDGEITPSTTFCFALVIAAGHTAIPLVALASLLADAVARKSAVRIAFNVGQYALSLGAAWLTLSALSDVPTGADIPFAPDDLGAIVAAGVVFFIVNSTLVGAVIALLERRRLLAWLFADIRFEASSTALLLGLSPLVVLAGSFSLLLLPLLLLPVISAIQSQRHAVAREIDAVHDSLTGLPNRRLLADRVHAALRVLERTGERFALVVLDLDRFKEVNDTLGHQTGDDLLREVARRLRAALRDGDVPARLGGDEFAVLLADCDREEAEQLGRALLAELSTPVALARIEMDVRASMGIAVAPEHGTTVEDLVQRADAAMYAAKRGRTRVTVYEPGSSDGGLTRSGLERELQAALGAGELIPHFQPTVDAQTGQVTGVEALLRWEHPQRGLLFPGAFMELAEQTGLIVPATWSVLSAALDARRRWLEEGVDLRVAVNLSPRSLMHRGLPDEVARILRRHAAPPGALQLEMTESMVMADPERAEQMLVALTKMGISIAIDDFGTGYSSLARLRSLPVDTIKIDRSFVTQMHTDRSDAVIVRSTIDLGHNLGLRVVAEGVETGAALEHLRALRCDVVQGFYISRAIPADRIVPFVREYDDRHGAAAG
jgi:diguanylate cyclase (GGDEF)-like protein